METVWIPLIAVFLASGVCAALAGVFVLLKLGDALRQQGSSVTALTGTINELRKEAAGQLQLRQEDYDVALMQLKTLQKDIRGMLRERENGSTAPDLYRLHEIISDVKKLQAQTLPDRSTPPADGAELADVKALQKQIADNQRASEQALLQLQGELTTLNFALAVTGDPSDIVVGPSDSYANLDQNWQSIHDTAGRQLAGSAIDGPRARTAVIITLGQSNIANHGAGRYAARGRVDNFNLYDGRCYHAGDPLLGASGDGGNPATRLGDLLIDAGLFDRVVLAPIAMGGTLVEQWAEYGMFNRRIPVVIRRLHDAGLAPDFILWQQGEGNPGMGDAGGRQYRKNLLEVVRTFRKYGVDAPFFVALCTRCGPEPHPNADNIRAGQKGAVNPTIGVHLGPDTDTIGIDHRFDMCHFDETGLAMAASVWLEVIAKFQIARFDRPSLAGC